MGSRRIVQCLVFILLSLFPSSGSFALRERGATGHSEKLSISTSQSQKDITTPITTVPTATPTTTIPVINPAISNPDSPPTSDNPMVAPATTTPTPTLPSSASSGGSWCVASQSAAPTALQVALDYACGYGGADCSPIQPAGSCYDPNTLRDHASYAFNSFYQKNPIPNSCNFGGTALITNTNPSKLGKPYK